MEGLIPLVYKSIKRNKTLRKYESLSSAGANSYNIEDFYPNESYLVAADGGGAENYRHRRTQSFHVKYDGGLNSVSTPKDKQLVRFTSHRMFSCVTGGV
ncbi:PREDICTED: uncharacterized protein LOC109227747 [Nicotiana attenuata]|uniref:Uncharacterized protein n=2 Tax=Nicotiana TaxID=4085 RepID=A0A1J6IAI9_NICAT|nr:PREDICTED: uncharacterized protein LOC104236994 [Nicotiana sylvestris]XP_019248487.1 PREDICTED: uncharacterized protein LOC109227747 [Nicotiana attenuata]OIT01950.1 hypothetical protein A4A49_03446 [Nicotiana attenuata]